MNNTLMTRYFMNAGLKRVAGILLILLLAGLGLTYADTSRSAEPDKDQTSIPHANPLYFKNLLKVPWGVPEAKYRIPVVISEHAGLARKGAPVTVRIDLPEDALSSSVTVDMPWGETVPCQVRKLEGDGNTVEVFFLIDLLNREYMPCFIYAGTKPRDTGDEMSGIRIKEEGPYLELANEQFRATLRKDAPIVTEFQRLNAVGGNQLNDDDGLLPEGNILICKGSFMPPRIVEDGFLKKTVVYEGKEDSPSESVTITVISGVRGPIYSVKHRSGWVLANSRHWYPGAGLDEERDCIFLYPGEAGVVHERFSTWGLSKPKSLTEGWYVLADEATGEVVGEVFDFEKVSKKQMRMTPDGSRGFTTSFYFRCPSDVARGMLLNVYDPTGYRIMRRIYAEFHSPPVVQTAKLQISDNVPHEWERPVYGRDVIFAVHRTYCRDTAGDYAVDLSKHFVKAARRMGANWLSLWGWVGGKTDKWAITDEYETTLKNMVKEAHANGMGIESGKPGGYLAEEYQKACAYGQDMVFLQDERAYRMFGGIVAQYAEHDRAAFEKKYGYPPPDDPASVENLADEKYQNVVLFQMERLTEELKKLATAARKANPDAIIGNQVNGGALTNIRRGAPQDWEAHSYFLDTISMDPYMLPNRVWKHYVKRMLSMFNNEKPVWVFWGNTKVSKDVRLCLDGLAMWGVDGFSYFPHGLLYAGSTQEVKKNRYRMTYTGLGDMIASYSGVKQVGILFDRAGMIDSIRHAQWTNLGPVYERRLMSLLWLNNVQSELVMSRYFDAGNLAQYPLVAVPNDPVMSDELAQALLEYVEKGGTAYIEGETLNNRIVQQLCGVAISGEAVDKDVRVMSETPFDFHGRGVNVKNVDAEIRTPCAEGNAALYAKKTGKGRVIYSPLILTEMVPGYRSVSDLVRGVFLELAGAQPVEAAEKSYVIDSNLSVDGNGNYLLAIINWGMKDLDVPVKVNMEQLPEVFVDYDSGKELKCEQTNMVMVPSKSVRYVYVGSHAGIQLPETVVIDQTDTSAYGTEYVSQAPDLGLLAVSLSGEVKAEKDKRHKEDGKTYIAVLTDKGCESDNKRARVRGDIAICEALQDLPDVQTDYVWGLDDDVLGFYDVIVVPNIGWSSLPPVLRVGWEKNIREYVENGGSVLLAGHAMGRHPCDYPIFPEIGLPTDDYAPVNTAVIVSDHPAAVGGDNALTNTQSFATLYPVYEGLRAAAGGTVLAVAARENGLGGVPVVVAGEYGEGRVILTGLGIGAKSTTEEGMSEGEEKLLHSAVRWLGGK